MVRQLIAYALAIYIVILLIRVVFSWIPVDPQSPWQRLNAFCFRATEPVLAPVRNLIPAIQVGGMGIDISFMLVFFVLIFAWRILSGGV